MPDLHPLTRPAVGEQTLKILAQWQSNFPGDWGVWRQGPTGWHCLPTVSGQTPQDSHPSAPPPWLLGGLETAALEPQLSCLGDGRGFLSLLSEAEDGSPEVVAGTLTLDHRQLALTAARLAIGQSAAQDQQEMLDHYATRLSASFEELCFLRRLSKHVDDCVADRSLAEVGPAILPQLRQLLNVETMALVEASHLPNQTPDPGRLYGQDGELPGDLRAWQDFISGLGSANRQVLVRNQRSKDHPMAGPVPREVRSVVLVPIEKDGLVFGWLLGVNKCPPQGLDAAPMNSMGHDEIGSMEASLLEAAALVLGSHANNHRLFRELENLVVDVTHALVSAIEARDAYTSGHSNRVALMARRIAGRMHLSYEQRQDIFLCGLLHDVGKIGVPDHILLKPGKLTDEEFAAIKQHPEIGVRLLQGLKPLEKLLPGVLHHHESMDGTGYPHGLRGEEIPLMARILAVADSFDAMTSDRPYRRGMPIEKAESILREGSGSQWDPEVVQAYFAARQEIAAICHHDRQNAGMLTPPPAWPVRDWVVTGAWDGQPQS